MIEWEKFYHNDQTLKELCEPPDILRYPVGSVVHVRKGMGYKVAGKWYRAYPSYIVPINEYKLRELCSKLPGFELIVGEELTEKEWRRGWVDTYYPLSGTPVFKCVLPGMLPIELRIVNAKKAAHTVETKGMIPVCPTCTLEMYDGVKETFDKAMTLFIHRWLWGRGGDRHGD